MNNLVTITNKDAWNGMIDVPDGSVHAVICDPEYDLSQTDMKWYMAEFRRVCKGTIIVFAAPENQWTDADQFCFWVKPISTKNTSKHYSRFVEMIQVFHGPESKWMTGRNWANYVNVFHDVIEAETIHPYQKPVALMERLVLNHTAKGDHILDPFCGSGTTLLAARRNGRRSTGFEKDKERYDKAVVRLANE